MRKIIIDVDEWIADMEAGKYKINDTLYAKGCNDVLDHYIEKFKEVCMNDRDGHGTLCKDCIHYSVCNWGIKNIVYPNNPCVHFKHVAEFAPIVPGEWIKVHLTGCEPFYLCSICDKLHDRDYTFCNECGAKNVYRGRSGVTE